MSRKSLGDFSFVYLFIYGWFLQPFMTAGALPLDSLCEEKDFGKNDLSISSIFLEKKLFVSVPTASCYSYLLANLK